jgi:hypothetical protein
VSNTSGTKTFLQIITEQLNEEFSGISSTFSFNLNIEEALGGIKRLVLFMESGSTEWKVSKDVGKWGIKPSYTAGNQFLAMAFGSNGTNTPFTKIYYPTFWPEVFYNDFYLRPEREVFFIK